MTDDEARDVLAALANEPYPWARPGARYRQTSRSRGVPVYYHGVILGRTGVGPDTTFTVRRDGDADADVFGVIVLGHFVGLLGDAFEPEDQP